MALSTHDMVLFLVGILFLVGLVTFVIGLLILVLRASSSDVQLLAAQAGRLVQKGMTEQVAGLVGNATVLLDSLNQLVRNTRGVGIFLTFTGLGLMVLAVWLGIQFYQVQL
ncbi:MAG: hypothetical protein ACKOC5_05715 [Chloroflexota bacterium]